MALSARGRKLVGCLVPLALLIAFVVGVAVLPGTEARSKRERIEPGMTASQVLEVARGWFYANLTPLQEGEGASPLGLTPARTDSELERVTRLVSEEMAKAPVGWKLTFGYITLSPRRAYFSVELDRNGRVVEVSDVTFGRP